MEEITAVQEQELFTVAELAEQFNITKDGMQKRINRLGLKPVSEPNRTLGIAAKYDKAQLARIQEEEEERILKEAQHAADVKAISVLKDRQKDMVVESMINQMDDMELAMAAASFITRLIDRAAEKQKTVDELQAICDDQAIRLGEAQEYKTVMQINTECGKGWSLQECISVGRRMSAYCKAHGYEKRYCEAHDVSGRFDKVGLYPMQAWNEVYDIEPVAQ